MVVASSVCFDAFHNALDRGLTEIIRIGFHGQAISIIFPELYISTFSLNLVLTTGSMMTKGL